MKRDWDVIGLILAVAENASGNEALKEDYLYPFMNRRIGEDKEFEESLSYNIRLLREEKFLRPAQIGVDSIGRITWRGHNLLDDLRRKSVPAAARNLPED